MSEEMKETSLVEDNALNNVDEAETNDAAETNEAVETNEAETNDAAETSEAETNEAVDSSEAETSEASASDDEAPIEYSAKPPTVSEADVDRFESILDADDSWKKVKRPPKWSLPRAALMIAVLVAVPWLISGEVGDLGYFFSSSTPTDLGDSAQYIRDGSSKSVKQDFADNEYVKMQGYPVRQIVIQAKEGFVHKKKFVYQLMGSSVYVQEGIEGSKYEKFVSSTQSGFAPDNGVAPVEVTGRLRRFDANSAKLYAPIRDYYAKQYGVTFCDSISKSERQRLQAQLGKGGLALQVMPDRAVIAGQTDSKTTIRKIVPLKGRNAVAIGDGNQRFTTNDAGLTWKNTKLPYQGQVTGIAYDKASGAIVYASRGGRIGPEDYVVDGEFMKTSQDVEDLMFNDMSNLVMDENNAVLAQIAPAMIAVGREGLIELAWQNREGWLPAAMNSSQNYNDVIRLGNKLIVVGAHGEIMTHSSAVDDKTEAWKHEVSPVDADWQSITALSDALVVVGSRGQVARLDRQNADARWEVWSFDDVPGIEIKSTLNRSAVSGDGKTWVAVGDDGLMMVAQRQEDGQFGRVQAISASFKGYGFVDDLLHDGNMTSALSNMLDRHTNDDLYDVAWHNGVFYAVGDNGLMMTSSDGHTWQRVALPVNDKRLRAITFVNDTHGYIAGEAGTMLITVDGGTTWRIMKSPTKRTILRLATDPSLKDAFVFSGNSGMWGYCYTEDYKCFLRSRNSDNDYFSLALSRDAESPKRMQILAVGENGTVEAFNDEVGPDSRHSVLSQNSDWPFSMAIADEPVPLRPGYGVGQLGLIGTQNGLIYRSDDAGYTFVPQATGLTGNIKRALTSSDSDIAYVLSSDGMVARVQHGFAVWKPVMAPEKARFVDVALQGKTAILADEHCLYTLAPSEDAELVKRACVSERIDQLAALSSSRVAIAAESTLYTLDINGTSDPEKAAAALPATHQPMPAGEDTRTGVNFTWGNNELLACGNSIWYRTGLKNDQQQFYRYVNDAWSNVTIPAGSVVGYACVDGALAIATATTPKPGVWRLDMTKIAMTGAELAWSMNVGFDPAGAQLRYTADGYWFVSAMAPNGKAPLILRSRDGKKWSWRSDRTTDYYAVAQGQGVTAVVGANGTVMLSKNMGLTWSEVKNTAKHTLRDVCISKDGTFGIAVGDAGTILYTKKSIDHWSKSTYKLTTDLTSCTIDETDGRFSVYIAGKDGLFYTATDRSLSRIELITSEYFENIESLATLQSGEVIAVGGNYQDPETICEDGFILVDGERPIDMWKTLLLCLALFVFWIYTFNKLVLMIKHRNDPEVEILG